MIGTRINRPDRWATVTSLKAPGHSWSPLVSRIKMLPRFVLVCLCLFDCGGGICRGEDLA